jgi:hypothetical protein
MKQRGLVLGAVLCALGAPAAAAGEPAPFTDSFRLEDCTFSNSGRNAYFSLNPGDRLVFEGEDDGETLELQITVLRDRQPISFQADGDTLSVSTRVVEEREWVDGELVEVSRNFFARCDETDDVFYFGEDVDIYEEGEIVSHDGAWRAGRNGALPGLIMPGRFLLGARYYQEIAPGVALDRAENVAMGLTLETEAGTLEECIQVVETSPLEPGSESTKIYCPGVGLAQDSDAVLVDFDVQDENPSRSRR